MIRRLAVLAAAVALSLATAADAQAAFGLTSFNTSLTDPGTVASPSGANLLTAGAHPDLKVGLRLRRTTDDIGAPVPDGNLRDLRADLPRGFVVDPTAAPACPQAQLRDTPPSCPANTQVGVVDIFFAPAPDQPTTVPLYNVAQPDGAPAQLGFFYLEVLTKLSGRVREDGSFGLSADVANLTEALAVVGADVTVWGVPADPAHDAQRSLPSDAGLGAPSTATPEAFTSNPTQCSTAQSFSVTASSYQAGSTVAQSSDSTEPDGAPYEFSGCDSLPFAPSAAVTPTTSAPDSPTGLDVSVGVPQSSSPGVRATSHLRDLKVTLPPGMAVNPAAADGLQACSPAQIGLGSSSPVACPEASTLGTASITTPLLAEPLDGRVYLAKQGDNPFGTLLGLYLVVEGSNVRLKLPGRIDLDGATGQLVATFADNPQLPFSKLGVHLDGGPLAPLTTPASCGSQSAAVELTPWSGGATQVRTSAFSINCSAGLGLFRPGFNAGTAQSLAGASSPLIVNVDRPDGQPVLNRVSLRLPTGLLAKLRGVRRCAGAQADAGVCDALSRVGSATVAAGAGSKPFPLGGDVFLTGPYKGAPFGLAVRVRAVAGPLDLGTVVVRQALFIDPDDTHVDVVSDPLPTILRGIPIRLRSLDVNVDRPDFTVNPTSCAAKRVRGNLGAADGQSASIAVGFRVGGCDGLELSPKLALRLGGKGRTLRDGGHPSLKAILTQPSGQSNLKRAQVKLPLSLALDPDNAQTLCEFAEGRKSAPSCPKGSVVGTAKARTPLLGRTLSGPVYFVKGQRTDRRTGRIIKTLPTLVVPLSGDGVRINLRAKTAVSGGRLVATFDPIPDAPVSRFDFNLKGGSNGILVANSSVCSKSRALAIGIRGHNNDLAKSTPTLAASCD